MYIVIVPNQQMQYIHPLRVPNPKFLASDNPPFGFVNTLIAGYFFSQSSKIAIEPSVLPSLTHIISVSFKGC